MGDDAIERCKDAVRERGFRTVRSGGYLLSSVVPVQLLLDRLPWSPEEVNWLVVLSGPGAQWRNGGIEPVVGMFGQDDQAGRDWYDLRSGAECDAFVADFEQHTLRLIDLRNDPMNYVDGLLDREIVPRLGWEDSARDVADVLLWFARLYGLPRVEGRAKSILRDDGRESPEQRRLLERYLESIGRSLEWLDTE